MITANQSFNEFKYGVKLQGVNLGSGFNTVVYAANTTGSSPNTVLFNGTTTLIAGTVVGFFAVSPTTVAGTIVLFGTTAGTIATVNVGTVVTGSGTGTQVFFVAGTNVLNAAVAVGDILQVSSITNAGTAACYVIMQTVS